MIFHFAATFSAVLAAYGSHGNDPQAVRGINRIISCMSPIFDRTPGFLRRGAHRHVFPAHRGLRYQHPQLDMLPPASRRASPNRTLVDRHAALLDGQAPR